MAVHTTQSRVVYQGNGVAKRFAIPYRFDLHTDLKVFLGTILARPDVDYTIAGAEVAFTVAPANGVEVIVQRLLPLTQTVDLQIHSFDPRAATRADDRIVMMLQQLNDGMAQQTLHGDQPGGTLHEVATDTQAGFVDPGERKKWNDHTVDRGNPHGVTPGQIGAAAADHNHDGQYAPVGYVPPRLPALENEVGQIQIDMSGWHNTLAPLQQHVERIDNPHGVTPGQIGAVTPAELANAVGSIPKGDKGDPGTPPHIDPTSGRWYVGAIDTGVKAQGPKGDTPTSMPWSAVTARPTTLGGYGITDAATQGDIQVIAEAVDVYTLRGSGRFQWDAGKEMYLLVASTEGNVQFPTDPVDLGGGRWRVGWSVGLETARVHVAPSSDNEAPVLEVILEETGDRLTVKFVKLDGTDATPNFFSVFVEGKG